jgi:hypothetical protein
MRRAARVDRNQAEIVEALRKAGATVHITSSAGDGFPDLVVAYQRQTYLLEVKDGTKPPSERELTPDQVRFHVEWNGGPCLVVNSVSEALAAIGVEQ